MAKILKARKSTIALVTFGLLATGIAVAEANGTWKEPNSMRVSQKYSIVKICDGTNLIYVNDSGTGLFQVVHNATECGGTN